MAQQIGVLLARNMLSDTDETATPRPSWAMVEEVFEYLLGLAWLFY